MEAALRAARQRHEPLIIVLGHPRFYPRFGFRPARPQGIVAPFTVADDVWMVRWLRTVRPPLRGRIVYPPAFAVAEPAGVD